MVLHYSANTGGFYDDTIHGSDIPDDAVEIASEEHSRLMAGHSEGMIIVAGEDGFPLLSERPIPTIAELAASVRADRDALLKASDWVALRAMETGEPMPADWAAYRQALRDVPEQEGFPTAIDWPVSPSAQEV